MKSFRRTERDCNYAEEGNAVTESCLVLIESMMREGAKWGESARLDVRDERARSMGREKPGEKKKKNGQFARF